ncbi:MAG: Proteasome-associated ATPase [Parcubacteria group bacterium GW2011_GWA2_47_10]|nr:MAG: Proteasome-associated ATPase [Parcubacteria group bacterium GW2011_GWA2_47_10]
MDHGWKRREEIVRDLEAALDRIKVLEDDVAKKAREIEKAITDGNGKLDKAYAEIDRLKAQHGEEVLRLRAQVVELGEELMAFKVPPFTIGVVLGYSGPKVVETMNEDGSPNSLKLELYWVAMGGRPICINVSPAVLKEHKEKLIPGAYLLLNGSANVIDVVSPENYALLNRIGEEVTVDEIISDDQVRVLTRMDEKRVVRLPKELVGALKAGDKWLLPSASSGMFVGGPSALPKEDIHDLELEEVPDITFEDVGGLEKQLEQIRDLSRLISKERGKEVKAFFYNIKGPELLNKYVGETERKIRDVFRKAKEKASDGAPVIIFFDEMDSMLRTRGAGISSDMEATTVPQFLSELDGIEGLKNVIVIGASNRQDLIDPAVLRPGRLSVKIKIERPDAGGAVDILSKYLKPGVPLSVKYWNGEAHTYETPNRFRDLLPGAWKKVDDQLTGVREALDLMRLDEVKMVRARIDRETAERTIKDLEVKDAALAKEARLTLERQPEEWTHELWHIESEKDAFNFLTYKTIEMIFIETDKTYMYFSREGELVIRDSRFLKVHYRNSDSEILYHKDFISGAALENIVNRAKKYALKRLIRTKERGVKLVDLWRAVNDEFKENEDLPNSTNPDDWARIMGRKGQPIVHVESMSGEARKTQFDKAVEKVINTGQYL